MDVKVSHSCNCKLQLKKLQTNYSYILGYRSYRLISVTVTVIEKVTVTVAITVTVSLRDYKVTYASFQAGRRPARKLVSTIDIFYIKQIVRISKNTCFRCNYAVLILTTLL